MTYALNWDLDSLFPGGINSAQLKTKLTQTQSAIASLGDLLDRWDAASDAPAYQQFEKLITQLQQIDAALGQMGIFITAVGSADVANPDVAPMEAELRNLGTQAENVSGKLKKVLVQVPDANFAAMLATPALQPIAFNLTEMRNDGKELLDDKTEALISRLNLDGKAAWSSHYDSLVATVNVPFHDANGKAVTLSAGQADNNLLGNADPQYRADLLPAWEQAWTDKEQLFADTLNHLAGFRLTEYAAHGTTDFLRDPLRANRMSAATLNTIWQVVDDNKQFLLDYLDRKAALLGKKHAGWQDVEAPLNLPGSAIHQFTYDEAASFIIKHYGEFSPKMAALAKHAFEHRWIEAEDRAGKAPGGWMESAPETNESRIFMTFTGSPNDVATLAHELGHAFHSSVISDLPQLRQDYAMNVAETASTFGELIVADANVKAAKTDAEKITLLNAKMDNPLAMFLNIRARYLFETRFYQLRQKKLVTPAELNELMLNAQKEAFGHDLSTYSPHLWASKLHFYIDEPAFYNFPYVFGYLFSLGIYAKAQQAGDFEDSYIALLRDTANMTTEELAQKHLGVDLTQPDFWLAGVKLIKRDVADFMRLTDPLVK
ncbi:MAG: M3 family oligoendopeptidase [Levilactobacillus sp.]|jgi:pepF/M3 family oligoendopeptidase|uniref:M3 family oligoendopeptidase n=1 Tax=Levilactobacillus sp. TaxID=2767919 RepID=UPI00258A1C12|nr:M3 family oligoendopeptidase [Levilactobacillus sp.]MCI1552920.1 M3 family oligoendopeptidase [Levilactobacillus sp.]MCI1598060.1 M3 family oligoendopeptidase [Levilactobacillus sp.]MCI1606574.1 M3 family oligoendopeptidase [Levilactobacillus sp.]